MAVSPGLRAEGGGENDCLLYGLLTDVWLLIRVHLGAHSYPSGEGNSTPTPVLLPGKSHRWKSLVGCSPWGR